MIIKRQTQTSKNAKAGKTQTQVTYARRAERTNEAFQAPALPVAFTKQK